jgi:hypothetical protein
MSGQRRRAWVSAESGLAFSVMPEKKGGKGGEVGRAISGFTSFTGFDWPFV